MLISEKNMDPLTLSMLLQFGVNAAGGLIGASRNKYQENPQTAKRKAMISDIEAEQANPLHTNYMTSGDALLTLKKKRNKKDLDAHLAKLGYAGTEAIIGGNSSVNRDYNNSILDLMRGNQQYLGTRRRELSELMGDIDNEVFTKRQHDQNRTAMMMQGFQGASDALGSVSENILKRPVTPKIPRTATIANQWMNNKVTIPNFQY